MIVVRSVRELENGRAALEVVPAHEPGALELRKHAIDRREPELLAAVEQRPVDRLGRHVPLRGSSRGFPEPSDAAT